MICGRLELEIKKTEKLDAIKDYLKQAIYQELKQEIADEFEKRFILVLEMEVKRILKNEVTVELIKQQEGYITTIKVNNVPGLSCYNPTPFILPDESTIAYITTRVQEKLNL
jgi:hypothetical protein